MMLLLDDVKSFSRNRVTTKSNDFESALGKKKQDAQLSQRDRAAGCVSFGQMWKTGTGRQ